MQVDLLDTTGWQAVESVIEEQAQELGAQASDAAHLVLHCIPHGEERPTRFDGAVLRICTKADDPSDEATMVSIHRPDSISRLKSLIQSHAAELAQPALAPSQARCQHHMEDAIIHLRAAHLQAVNADPPELLALSLRAALDALGAMTGSIYTNDLLDRIFSRFCIGK